MWRGGHTGGRWKPTLGFFFSSFSILCFETMLLTGLKFFTRLVLLDVEPQESSSLSFPVQGI